jgi:hypothetical protein
VKEKGLGRDGELSLDLDHAPRQRESCRKPDQTNGDPINGMTVPLLKLQRRAMLGGYPFCAVFDEYPPALRRRAIWQRNKSVFGLSCGGYPATELALRVGWLEHSLLDVGF